MSTKRIKERFAHLPISVMQSEAWRTLPHGARTVLLVLAVQYSGTANGVQNLARATCRRYGLAHSRALKHAKTLEERGLIVRTYTAAYTTQRSRVPSQWALGWLDITHAGNHELRTIRRAVNAWREWTMRICKVDETAAVNEKLRTKWPQPPTPTAAVLTLDRKKLRTKRPTF